MNEENCIQSHLDVDVILSNKKVKIACVNCKKAKTACSPGRPCERCIRMKKQGNRVIFLF